MPSHKGPDSKMPVNVELARAVYGRDTVVVSQTSCMPGFPDRDPTPEEEAAVEKLRTEPLPREEVHRRRLRFLTALREMGDIAAMIGANAHDTAWGFWSNDLPEGAAEILDRLQAEHTIYVNKVAQTLNQVFACYNKDPRYNCPD